MPRFHIRSVLPPSTRTFSPYETCLGNLTEHAEAGVWLTKEQQDYLAEAFARYAAKSGTFTKCNILTYRFVRNKRDVQLNIGRALDIERSYYSTVYVGCQRTQSPSWLNYAVPDIGEVESEEEEVAEPRRETSVTQFTPSERLVELVLENMAAPQEKEAVTMLRKIKGLLSVSRIDEKINVSELIKSQLEGLLVAHAEIAHYNKISTVPISREKEFVREVSLDIVERLGLDPYKHIGKVLELLLHEFREYVRHFKPERYWGTMKLMDSELLLEINKDAFAVPDLKSIAGSKWKK